MYVKIVKPLALGLLVLLMNCTPSGEFEKDCDLCKQVNQKDVEYTLNNFLHKDSGENIREQAQVELAARRDILIQGFKFEACGCTDGRLVYHLWCATDDTYKIEVQPFENDQFLVTGIVEAVFDHP